MHGYPEFPAGPARTERQGSPGWAVSRGILTTGLVAIGIVFAGCGRSQPPAAGNSTASAGTSTPAGSFDSPEGNFRVAFPGQPKSVSQQVQSPAGPQTLRTFLVENQEKVVYSLTFSDIPESVIAASDPEALLDGGTRGMAKQWDVTKQGPIRLGEHPGRSIQFTARSPQAPEVGLGRARVYLVGGRLYQVLAVGPQSKVQPEAFERFLDSFQLIRDVKAIARSGPPLASRPVQPGAGTRKPAPSPASPPAQVAQLPTVSDPGPDPTQPAEVALDVSYDPDRLVDLPQPKLGGDNESFREVAPEGGLLVGVRVGYVKAFGGTKVGAVWPVYQVGTNYKNGARYGKQAEPAATVVARPGYAVGAINTRTGLLVDGFQIVFMKVKDGRLDPGDSYQSDWLGDAKGGGERKVSGDGRLVVGLHGKTAGREINALGLVVADATGGGPAPGRAAPPRGGMAPGGKAARGSSGLRGRGR